MGVGGGGWGGVIHVSYSSEQSLRMALLVQNTAARAMNTCSDANFSRPVDDKSFTFLQSMVIKKSEVSNSWWGICGKFTENEWRFKNLAKLKSCYSRCKQSFI